MQSTSAAAVLNAVADCLGGDPLIELDDLDTADLDLLRQTTNQLTSDLQAKHAGLTHSYSNFSIGVPVVPGGTPKLSLSAFVQATSSILSDFVKTGDCPAALEGIKKLDCQFYHDVLIVKAIAKVLAESEEIQSAMASFLTVLYDAKLLTGPQVMRAFEKLIQSAENLHSTIPNVEDKLFNFFSVGVEDSLVDYSFLLRLPEGFVKSLSPVITDNEPHILAYCKTLHEYKERCKDFMPEFFNSGEAGVVKDFLKELSEKFFPDAKEDEEEEEVKKVSSFDRNDEEEVENAESDESPVVFPVLKKDMFRHEMVRRLIGNSLGGTNAQREMVSKVLSDLYVAGPYTFRPDDIQLGVLRILASMQEVVLDVPRASEMLSNFIVRMNVDDILPPAFVCDFLRLNLGNALGVETLWRAFRWMTDSAKHHLLSERFGKVWTGTEGYRPEVEEFKRELRTIIFNYFNTADVQTALALFNALDMSPDQEAEAIRKVVAFALERQEDAWALAVGFLKTLRDTGEVDSEAVLKGFDQIRDRLGDISIDCPSARIALDSYFIPESIRLDLLPSDWKL